MWIVAEDGNSSYWEWTACLPQKYVVIYFTRREYVDRPSKGVDSLRHEDGTSLELYSAYSSVNQCH